LFSGLAAECLKFSLTSPRLAAVASSLFGRSASLTFAYPTFDFWTRFGPGNGSPMATNVVLAVVSGFLLLSDFRFRKVCRFSTDRRPYNETFHAY